MDTFTPLRKRYRRRCFLMRILAVVRQDYRSLKRNNAIMECRGRNNKKKGEKRKNGWFLSAYLWHSCSDNSPANSLRQAARWPFDVRGIVSVQGLHILLAHGFHRGTNLREQM